MIFIDTGIVKLENAYQYKTPGSGNHYKLKVSQSMTIQL